MTDRTTEHVLSYGLGFLIVVGALAYELVKFMGWVL